MNAPNWLGLNANEFHVLILCECICVCRLKELYAHGLRRASHRILTSMCFVHVFVASLMPNCAICSRIM